jgi:lysophospholipase L1-like esterase
MSHRIRNSNLVYVALGDSFTWGFVDLYAAHIESDLGVRVNLRNSSVGGQRSDELLESLREDEPLRALLHNADVITFMIPMAHFQEPSIAYVNGGDWGNQEGMRAAFALYQRDADGIFVGLLSLRKPSETILRVMDCYLPPFLIEEWNKHGAYAPLRGWWDAFNRHVARLASEYVIPLARVRDAFNGISGDENPVEYIGEDGWHTNARGAARIAELHRDLGYAPLAS